MSKKKHRHEPIPEFEPLSSALIDSHCHVVPRTFGDQTLAVVERMFRNGLAQAVNIGAGYGLDGNRQALEMYAAEPRLHPTIGIHPHEAHLLEEDPGLYDTLRDLARRPEVVAYGELGLDYYYNHSNPEIQRRHLHGQLELARDIGKPVVFHDRDAHAEMLEILDAHRSWEQGVVIHCFSGDWALAEQVLARGGMISIPGIVTYPSATELKEVAARTPLERLLIETDSPYLAPVPYRGRKNEPMYVHAVARAVAVLRGQEVEDVVKATTENARRFFRLPVLEVAQA